MKKSNLLSIAIVLMISLFAISCSNKTTNKEEPAAEEEVDKTGPEYTSAFICPMHCEGSGSAEEGSCPKCGMPLEKNKDFEEVEGDDTDVKEEELSDDQNEHEGHDHGANDQ